MKPFYTIPEVRAIADISNLGNNHYMIHRINVPKGYRGKGYGSKLLDQICKDADIQQVVLVLSVVESDGLSNDDLRLWYERRGFRQPNPDSYFIRHPKIKTPEKPKVVAKRSR